MTRYLKARVVEPEDKAIAREQLAKHACTATYIRNDRKTVGSDNFYVVFAKAAL
jgi:hypothetical protein